MPTQEAGLAARIEAVLPQTQCTRCGYPDCAAYAQAIATGDAGINQCPRAEHRALPGLRPLPDGRCKPLTRVLESKGHAAWS